MAKRIIAPKHQHEWVRPKQEPMIWEKPIDYSRPMIYEVYIEICSDLDCNKIQAVKNWI